MRTLTLKKVTPELYEKLKESARVHHRSLNSEAIHRLEASLLRERVDPEELIGRARALRERLAHVRLTDQALREARDRGRP